MGPGTGVCRVLTGVHWPGQLVAVGILDPALARGPRCMAEVPTTERGHGGRLVAAACKRRHMGTVAGRRGTDVPRGTAAHLDRRRPVPRPATAKVASGIAVTARGQLATGTEWPVGSW